MALFSLAASCKATSIESLVHSSSISLFQSQLKLQNPIKIKNRHYNKPIMCCSSSNSSSSTAAPTSVGPPSVCPPVIRKRKRYRKAYPGESKGITEEMRFAAMRLRNSKGKFTNKNVKSDNEDSQNSENDEVSEKEEGEDGDNETWFPSMEGFVKYLVDSKLVFDTVEQIVDKSDDVSYAYFRRTGLERSEGLAKDLEWFGEQNIEIPEPCNPGLSYVTHLKKLGGKNTPLFLCHFYNIYFAHIAGGQVISRQVSDKLLQGRELEFYKWDGDVQELLKGLREKLNMLGEHWSRDVKNKCLKETTKSFRYLGQIVRLIIL